MENEFTGELVGLPLDNIYEPYVSYNEIHVNEDEWTEMLDKYSQETLIKELSDAIVMYNIKLPYREITIEEVEKDYKALVELDTTTLKGDDAWGTKFDYKYGFNDHYINNTKTGNRASDFFHQEQRWTCDATGYPSPQRTWENEKFRLTLFKALFSLKVKEINPNIFRSIISLRKYIAAQFRPSAAKYIYDYFKAESVLDFSMGWGDRILGAHASKYVKYYAGFDPNLNLVDGYIKQIKTYQGLGTPMRLKLFPWGAEEEKIELQREFDLVFTSPPYFDKEKYDQSDAQSYKKFKDFDSWMDDFLCKVITLRTKNLKSGGHLVINISDIYSRKKHFDICDRMNDYIASTGQFEYVGAIGLKMPKRPMSKSAKTAGVYGEPIWCWKKK